MKRPRFLRFLLLAPFAFSLPAAANGELIPMTAWIHDPVIDSVDVSPDGNQLVALTLSNVNEAPDITVWDTRDLSKEPRRFSPSNSKAIFVSWLSNDQLLVIGRQKYDYITGGKTTRWFRDFAYLVDDEGKRFRTLLRNRDDVASVSLFDSLPQDPDKILVETTNLEFASDIYEVDLNKLTSKRIFRGATGESFIPDAFGNVKGRTVQRGGGDDVRIEFAYRNPETDDWETHHSLYAAEREGMQPVGFDVDGRTVYMVDNTGRDKQVIRKYDLIDRSLSDPIYADATIEATGIVQSNQPEDFGELVAFTGWDEGFVTDWVKDDWSSLQARVDAALPAMYNTIASISDDFSVAVIESSGPKEPGAFYLLIGGQQLVSLGRRMPFLKPEEMAEMTYVTYEARDGMQIPGYLTTPTTGDAPYPAVIMPHGGPWARDFLMFDRWAQFLANRGYVVLQPNYRGSQGFGQNLWRAGDREWGQKMQDDKDDGAAWLVEQGLVDKDRIAMFGYSYGGYAAMAAIVREDPPYQCAIAGAGLAELRTFDKITFEGRFGREFQNPTIAGLSPLDKVEDAKIPIFIFHGDRDQRVPIDQSRRYKRALERAGKDVEYLEIVDLWHSLPWFPQHHLAMLESMEDYLANRCGPGGL